MTQQANSSGFAGQWDPTDDTSEFNKARFLVRQFLSTVSTATLVEVVSCTNSDQVGPFGYVDVQPLVNLMDGAWNGSPHGIIRNIPYLRMQGGANAIIADPEKGDLGLCVFADRDISSVKSSQAQANPGSRRRFDMADGLYVGGYLNGTPTQYVRFRSDGLELVDKNGNSMKSSPTGWEIVGDVSITGTLKNNGVDVGSTHVHSGVTSGPSDTGPPI